MNHADRIGEPAVDWEEIRGAPFTRPQLLSMSKGALKRYCHGLSDALWIYDPEPKVARIALYDALAYELDLERDKTHFALMTHEQLAKAAAWLQKTVLG